MSCISYSDFMKLKHRRNVISYLINSFVPLFVDGSFSEEIMRTMVLVLANLFGRRFISKRHLRSIKPKSSIVSIKLKQPSKLADYCMFKCKRWFFLGFFFQSSYLTKIIVTLLNCISAKSVE